MSTKKLDNAKEKVCYKCLCNFELPTHNGDKDHVKTKLVEFNPENYAYFESNLGNVKKLLSDNKKVCISLDATFAGWYRGKNFKQLSHAIKKLGFNIIEETAIGASQVISEYSNLMELAQTNIVINTFCPSVVTLIEEHFPNLIESLAPVSSPMIAHAKLMRDTYGDVKVVYIGSCHSKVDESREELTGLYVNEVMSFADLDRWLEEENITIDEEDDDVCGVDNPISRIYPLSGGLTRALGEEGLHKYTPICVSGLDRCIDLFTSLADVDSKHKVFVDASVCENGCIDNSLFRANNKNIIDVLTALDGEKQPHDDKLSESGKVKYPHPMLYVEKKTKAVKPVAGIAKNKELKVDEYICIACGVRSCKDYAISIKEDKKAPFNKQLLTGSANVVLENSPNGVVTFNENFVITSINPMAEFIYQVVGEDVLNTVNTGFVDESVFKEAKSTLKPVIDKCYARDDSMYIERCVIYVKDANIYLLFATDNSSYNKSRKEFENLRFYADNIAKEITRFLEIEPDRIDAIQVKAEVKEKATAKAKTKAKKSTEVEEEKEPKPLNKNNILDASTTSLETSNKKTSNKTEVTEEKDATDTKDTKEAKSAPTKAKKEKASDKPKGAGLEAIKIGGKVDKSLVTIMVGPPFDKYYDTTMVSKLMTSDGIRVVCGKTTSQIVSKITGRSITAINGSDGIKDAPTTSIDGIHLITHGVMTISRVLEHLRNYQADPNHVEKMKDSLHEEATILSTFFINECEHINFLIGDSQDPTRDAETDPLASFGLKTNLINDLADLLEEMGKRVDLNLF